MKADVSNYDANIAKARKQLDNFKNDNLSFGGVMNQSSRLLTGIASKFVGLTGAIGAASSILKVAKDAFFSAESGIDEWGRTVEGAKGAYDVFLDTLRNGNWSNFFANLNDAISGARELYNALDRLGSIKSNNQAAIAIAQQQIAQLRLMKQQGQNVDEQLKQATANLARLQKQSVDAGKKAGTMTASQTIGNEIRSINGAPQINDKTIQAVVGGIMFKGQSEFDKYAKNLKTLEALGTVSTTKPIVAPSGYTKYIQSTTFDINKLTKEQQRQYVIAKAVTEKETDIQKGIAIYAQAVNEGAQSARQEFKYNRWSGAGSGGGGRSGGGSSGGSTTTPEHELTIQQQISELEKEAYTATAERRMEIGQTIQELDKELERQKEIRDQIHGIVKESPTETGISGMSSNAMGSYRNMVSEMMGNMEIGGNDYTAAMENLIDVDTLSNVLQEAMEDGVDLAATGINVEDLWDNILGGENIPDDVWQDLQDKINEQLADMGIDPIKIDFKTGDVERQAKKMKGDWKDAASAIEQVGSAMSSIEDPAAKVVGTVAQAIATIALGYAEAVAQAGEQGGPWAWIAFAATGLATMISTISAIHSATGYANGGIVGGSSYSGDNNLIRANSGEIVLTHAMQDTLAANLEGGGVNNLRLTASISGEQIRLALNNNGRRTGRGEYVTTKFG